MDRLACFDLPALPLQLLLTSRPQWAGEAAVVVARDRPTAAILWANAQAMAQRVAVGMRYAEGLSLCKELRAATVEPQQIQQAVEQLTRTLLRFSPSVEPARQDPGSFWLDAAGLERLYPSLRLWGEQIVAAVQQQHQLSGALVAGFSRFGTYALARTCGRSVQVLRNPEQELRQARAVPLAALALEPALRDALGALGITTVEGFVGLPRGGVLERFGTYAFELHALAAGQLWAPLTGYSPRQELRGGMDLEFPEDDLARLLFLLKRSLDPMLARLRGRGEKLAELLVTLLLADGRRLPQRVRPAAPTLAVVQILELVRLRLEALELETHVDGFELQARSAAAHAEQLQLFERGQRRDLEAANRALARVRAELGPGAVVHAVQQDRHLPEASFGWEPLERLLPAQPSAGGERTLVRRLQTPGPLEATGPGDAAVEHRGGPHVISGGWWQGEVSREYHYVEDRRGRLLWIFEDVRRGRWLLHAVVE